LKVKSLSDKINASLDNLRMQIAAARTVLHQAWEKYGETTGPVLAAGDDLDRLLNEYGRLTNRNRCNG
jgi:hypothetical protein